MNQAMYDIKELLEKAGLIAKGVVVIKAKENKSRPKEDSSGTWVQADDPFDPTDSRYTTTPVMNDAETLILGNWENELSPEEIEVLIKYGIPRFNVAHPRIGMRDNSGKLLPDTPISIYDGKTYDCSDPKQFAEVKILLNNECVALKREDCETYGTNFYWYKEEDEIAKKDLLLQARIKAIMLTNDSQRLDTEGRAMVIRYLTFTEPSMAIKYNMTPLQLEIKFKELCVDHPVSILKTVDTPMLKAEVAFYELGYQGLMMMEGEKVYRTSQGIHGVKGSFFAENKEEAVAKLANVENQMLMEKAIESVLASYGLKAGGILKKEVNYSDKKTSDFLNSLMGKEEEKDAPKSSIVKANFSPNPDARKLSKSALAKMNLEQLYAYAAAHNIELSPDLKKEGVIEVINNMGGID